MAWLLSMSSLQWPFGSDPPKAMNHWYSQNHCLVLCLCLMYLLCGDQCIHLLGILHLHGWVAIACVLYVVQYASYLSPILPSIVLNGESVHSLFLLQQPDMCRAIYVTNLVELLTRQEWWWALWCIVYPSSWLIPPDFVKLHWTPPFTVR